MTPRRTLAEEFRDGGWRDEEWVSKHRDTIAAALEGMEAMDASNLGEFYAALARWREAVKEGR